MNKTKLVLSNGIIFEGKELGATKASSGELVFTTGMVGYPQSFTDPSYYGQTLVFSFPLIGNYGLPTFREDNRISHLKDEGMESRKSWISGVVLSTPSSSFAHHSYTLELDKWLRNHNITGICDIDTRELVHQIRENPGLKAIITSNENENQNFFDPHSLNLIEKVSTSEKILIGKGKKRICLYDFGVKSSIINRLVSLDCEVLVVPWNSREDIDADGYLLSNGPGNPSFALDSLPIVKNLLKRQKPILGICLGHQILSMSIDAKVERLTNGHRGFNHPVIDTRSGKGYITSQNHGYHVIADTIPEGWFVSFKNANDGSVEGIAHKELPFESVQFHPEASGGPNDCQWILEKFVKSLK